MEPATLSADVRVIRRRYGCDGPCPKGEARYAILCPACDGLRPDDCETCESKGKLRGFKLMLHCPAHYQSYEISGALRAYHMMMRGFLPASGGVSDQPASFLQFTRVFGDETARIRAEQAESGG